MKLAFPRISKQDPNFRKEVTRRLTVIGGGVITAVVIPIILTIYADELKALVKGEESPPPIGFSAFTDYLESKWAQETKVLFYSINERDGIPNTKEISTIRKQAEIGVGVAQKAADRIGTLEVREDTAEEETLLAIEEAFLSYRDAGLIYRGIGDSTRSLEIFEELDAFANETLHREYQLISGYFVSRAHKEAGNLDLALEASRKTMSSFLPNSIAFESWFFLDFALLHSDIVFSRSGTQGVKGFLDELRNLSTEGSEFFVEPLVLKFLQADLDLYEGKNEIAVEGFDKVLDSIRDKQYEALFSSHSLAILHLRRAEALHASHRLSEAFTDLHSARIHTRKSNNPELIREIELREVELLLSQFAESKSSERNDSLERLLDQKIASYRDIEGDFGFYLSVYLVLRGELYRLFDRIEDAINDLEEANSIASNLAHVRSESIADLKYRYASAIQAGRGAAAAAQPFRELYQFVLKELPPSSEQYYSWISESVIALFEAGHYVEAQKVASNIQSFAQVSEDLHLQTVLQKLAVNLRGKMPDLHYFIDSHKGDPLVKSLAETIGLIQKGDFEGFLNEISKFPTETLSPNDKVSLTELTLQFQCLLGKWNEAASSYDQIIELAEEKRVDPVVSSMGALAYAGAGKPSAKQIISSSRNLLPVDPNQWTPYHCDTAQHLSMAYQLVNDLDSAITLLEEAEKSWRKSDSITNLGLANTLMRLSQLRLYARKPVEAEKNAQEALSHFTRITEIPSNGPVSAHLANLCITCTCIVKAWALDKTITQRAGNITSSVELMEKNFSEGMPILVPEIQKLSVLLMDSGHSDLSRRLKDLVYD